MDLYLPRNGPALPKLIGRASPFLGPWRDGWCSYQNDCCSAKQAGDPSFVMAALSSATLLVLPVCVVAALRNPFPSLKVSS